MSEALWRSPRSGLMGGRPKSHPDRLKLPQDGKPRTRGRRRKFIPLLYDTDTREILKTKELIVPLGIKYATPIQTFRGQRIPCGYCFSNWATQWDHLLPRGYRRQGADKRENLYPSCGRCNRVLGSKVFESLEAKREYMQNWLRSRGKWSEAATDQKKAEEKEKIDSARRYGHPREARKERVRQFPIIGK